jgi:hypothetical protein
VSRGAAEAGVGGEGFTIRVRWGSLAVALLRSVHTRARIPDRGRLGSSLADGPGAASLHLPRSAACDGSIGCMFLSFAYLAFSAVLRLLVGGRSSEFAKDVELLVLRHQLVVLERQQRCRPSLRPADRAFFAALARVLPQPRRRSLIVTPQTLFALASGTRPSQVDAAAAGRGPPARRSSGTRACSALRAREPGLGLPADRWRVAKARSARVAQHDQAHPARQPSWARAKALGPKLARVPPLASRQHARLRFLHRRDDLAPPLLRALLHRTRKPPSTLLAARPTRQAPG